MARLTAQDFPQELLELYDYYAHGRISKREFIAMAGKLAIGGMTGATLLGMLSPNYALATQVEFTDPDIKPEYIHYPSPQGHGEVRGYLVKPANPKGKPPAVVVVHENRGLNPYIEDVARRVAKAGYIALAPDGLSSVGGYPGNDEEGRALQAKVDPARLMNDFFAALTFLIEHPEASGKVGITGFCYGGGVANAAAVAFPELACAVPFYGRQPKAEDVPRIQAPLLLHYAALDNNINAGWPAYEAALKQHNKIYQAHLYPGVNHGFHNDSTPRYDKPAAELAWQRTLAWFEKYLH
ncbi:YghX family hydrolase [Pantoea brenneri]|uniref:YghX family hydrolase n=1 Tax=Pantoea brenneri TaxID=472694 RepID=UPI00289C3087|nr:YghX family hydrolase [Pantoea brenneri]